VKASIFYAWCIIVRQCHYLAVFNFNHSACWLKLCLKLRGVHVKSLANSLCKYESQYCSLVLVTHWCSLAVKIFLSLPSAQLYVCGRKSNYDITIGLSNHEMAFSSQVVIYVYVRMSELQWVGTFLSHSKFRASDYQEATRPNFVLV
jgi:hypothetical protein